MFSFFTDGGTYCDLNDNYIQQVFGNGTNLHCTGPVPSTVDKSVNIQAYSGRKAEHVKSNPITHRVNAADRFIMKIPIENHVLDKSEPESFKLL